MRANEFLFEKWSDKYKRSIDCSNPKGFSQKAHCAGRKKNEDYVSKFVNKVKTDFDKRSTLFGKGQTVKANTKPIPQKQNKTNEDADFYDQWDHDYPVEYSKYLEKTFGAPDEITNEQTVWHNKDGFKRIVCRDEYILHGSPAPHYDFVYCYIDLEVPEDLSDELAKCSGSILIDHLKNEVGARCGSLTANAVTLNFVLDVVAGRAEPVKEEYEQRILQMQDMFEKGEIYSNDWWEDNAGDANPKNPFYAESVNEDLRDWFGKGKKGGAGGGGWDRYNTKGERIGKCGDAKPNEGKPKCLSKSRAASLRAKGGKAAIAAAVKKKRREDPNKNRRGKAKNVSNTVKKRKK